MITLIAGMKGTGKSYFVKEQIKKASNLICMDLNKEYTGELVTSCDQAVKQIDKNNFPIRYAPIMGDEDDFFLALMQYENITLVIDEAHFYISAYDKKTPLFQLTRLARHLNTDIILITQRFADFPKQLVSQATKIITFKQWLPDDLKTLISWGFDSAELNNLEKYQKLTLEK